MLCACVCGRVGEYFICEAEKLKKEEINHGKESKK